ncbi:hypothetical protein [Deinococcus sp.]|uniref:hypothetical protein n=1 Tax=Deinococcus sp. TaxID=47478 RepID=UPI003CC558C1
MNEGGFLELVIPISYFLDDEAVNSRHDIEDAPDQLLSESELGEVSGGGSGSGVAIIDIEVVDIACIDKVLEQVAEIGQRFLLPDGTRVLQQQPQEQSYTLSSIPWP